MLSPVVTSEVQEGLLRRLNDALDAKRAELGYTNDEDLARALNVSSKTISFWRNGRWPRADHALIAVLASPCKIAA